MQTPLPEIGGQMTTVELSDAATVDEQQGHLCNSHCSTDASLVSFLWTNVLNFYYDHLMLAVFRVLTLGVTK